MSRAPMSCLPKAVQSQGRSDVRSGMNTLSAFAGVSVADGRGLASRGGTQPAHVFMFRSVCSTSVVLLDQMPRKIYDCYMLQEPKRRLGSAVEDEYDIDQQLGLHQTILEVLEETSTCGERNRD